MQLIENIIVSFQIYEYELTGHFQLGRKEKKITWCNLTIKHKSILYPIENFEVQ